MCLSNDSKYLIVYTRYPTVLYVYKLNNFPTIEKPIAYLELDGDMWMNSLESSDKYITGTTGLIGLDGMKLITFEIINEIP